MNFRASDAIKLTSVSGCYQNTKQQKLSQARLNQSLGINYAAFGLNPFLLSNDTHDNPAESMFGQLLWKITPTLELAGGARWTRVRTTPRVRSATAKIPRSVTSVSRAARSGCARRCGSSRSPSRRRKTGGNG